MWKNKDLWNSGKKINRLKLGNYKTFEQADSTLDDYNIFIGVNGSGKSNFLSAIRIIRDDSQHGFQDAVSAQGGYLNIRKTKGPVEIEWTVEGAGDSVKLGFYWYLKPETSKRDLKEGLITKGPVRRTEEAEFKILEAVYNVSFEDPEDITEILRYRVENGNGGVSDTNAGLLNASIREMLAHKGVEDGFETKFSEFLNSITEIAIRPGPNDGAVFIEFVNSGAKAVAKRFLNDLKKMGIGFTVNSCVNSGRTFDGPYNDGFLGFNHRVLSVYYSGRDPYTFARIRILDFEPKQMKAVQPFTFDKSLYENGSNIANVVKRVIEEGGKEQFLREVQTVLPHIEDIRVETFLSITNGLVVKETYSNEDVPSYHLSDGTICVMGLVLALFHDSSDLVVLEEPERNFHPKLIPGIMELVKEASKHKQIIISTHNPEFLRWSELENIRLVHRDEKGVSHLSRLDEIPNVAYLLNKEIGIENIFIHDNFGV